MKKRDYIFIFIFLSGMLFTVFQYVMITEEEVPHRKIELVKKQKSNNDTDGGNGDGFPADEEPANEEILTGSDDTMQVFFENSCFNFYSSASFHSYHSKSVFYSYLTQNINTPPPEI